MSSIDLHTHSNKSDGLHSPRDLIRLAHEEGLSTIAITDHDTLIGIDEALTAGEEFGIEVIPAVEISVQDECDSLHMLGYYIDHRNPALIDVLSALRKFRIERNEKIMVRLEELGYPLVMKEVLNITSDGITGRSHLAHALVKRGYFASHQEAFDKLLNRGGPAYVDRKRPPIRDAIQAIHSAGGAAVWAHPGLHADKMDDMIERLSIWVEYGLDGIESDYCNHTIDLRDRLRRLALSNELIYTGGSDFHGSIKPKNRLGCGPEGSKIDEKCLEMLKKRIEVQI